MNPALSQLRDIHLPAPVSWWPPAPGWWLLAAIALLAALGLYIRHRLRRRNRWRRLALSELARLRRIHAAQPSAAPLGELSVLLRRVAVSRFPREEVAALSGDDWLAFLDRGLDGGTPFQSDSGRLLAVSPYVPDAAIDTPALLALFDLAERWLKKLPAGAKK